MSQLVTKYAGKSDPKFKKIHEYDTILETLATPYSTSNTKRFFFSADIINGQGPCQLHHHIDIRVKNMDDVDGLQRNISNTVSGKKYLIYGKYSDAESHLTKNNSLIQCLWMFNDLATARYVKEADFTINSCGSRTDGEKPNGLIKGLIRVYRQDRFSMTFNWKSRFQNSAGFSADKNGIESTYSERNGAKLTSSYDNGKLSGLKEDKQQLLKNKSLKLDENADEVEKKTSVKYNENILVIKNNGLEVDASKTVNKILHLKDLIQETVDFVKELKDAIPKAGIDGDVSVDFLTGSFEASWGLAKSADSTQEYVWLEPDFNGTVKVNIFEVEGSITAGIKTASPEFLNWWGKELWSFELSLSLGLKSSLAISCIIVCKAGKVGGVENSVIPGCEYKGNKGKETQIVASEVEVKPICKGVAKVNLNGIGAEARMTLHGALKLSAAVVWPFDIRYKGELEPGVIECVYEATNKRPSKADPYTVWNKRPHLIKENYAFGGRTV